MVYIKLTNEMWVVSGLDKVLSPQAITNIDNNRYIPYTDFKNAARLLDQPIHTLIKRDHIITNLHMKTITKEAELTADDRKFRDQLKLKHQLRMLNGDKVKTDVYYFEEKKGETVKDFTTSISFAMTFIFSFFMAGLTGYYFGVYFLSLSFTHALMVAVVFIMGTIIIETSLFIIKQNREDSRHLGTSKHREKLQKSRLGRPKHPQAMGRQNQRPKID